MDVVGDSNLQALLAGTPLHLPGEAGEAARIVRANWILEAVRLGLAVDVDNAVIAGDLDLSGRYVPAAFSITNSRAAGISLGDARFLQALRFDGTTFEGRVILAGMRGEGDVSFAGVKFSGELDLSGVAIGGAL